MFHTLHLRRLNRSLLNALFALAFVAGCAGPHTPSNSPTPQTGFPLLPAPAELARRTAFTEGGLVNEGAYYESALPMQRVSTAGTDANFIPTSDGAPGIAFAVYSFGAEDYNRDLNLRFTWAQLPQTGRLWVGLANFSTNRWEWLHPSDVNVVGFKHLANHTGPAAAGYPLYCVVCLTGGGGPFAVLDRVRLGVPPGQPVITQMATWDFNRAGVEAPNDWMYIIGDPPDLPVLYHNFSFFQDQTFFASERFEFIDQGNPVPRYTRDEASHMWDGALPRPRAYRYNYALGSEVDKGSFVRLDGAFFGVALGSVRLAVGTPNEILVPVGDIADWQDTFIVFRMPGNLNMDLTGKVSVSTSGGQECTSSDDLYCSAYITGVAPPTDVDPAGFVAFSGFDFEPPAKTGEVGAATYLFWAINATYTNPFTGLPETNYALVAQPMAPDTVGPNLLTFDMRRLDSVEVEVFNPSMTASVIVPATQTGNATYYCFLWTGAIEPFSAPADVVAQSGILSQAVEVNVGGGPGPLVASLSANPTTTSALGGPPVQFDYSAVGGLGPYSYELDFGDGSALFSSSAAGSMIHAYTAPSGPGGYTATLTVTDSAAGTDTAAGDSYRGSLSRRPRFRRLLQLRHEARVLQVFRRVGRLAVRVAVVHRDRADALACLDGCGVQLAGGAADGDHDAVHLLARPVGPPMDLAFDARQQRQALVLAKLPCQRELAVCPEAGALHELVLGGAPFGR